MGSSPPVPPIPPPGKPVPQKPTPCTPGPRKIAIPRIPGTVYRPDYGTSVRPYGPTQEDL